MGEQHAQQRMLESPKSPVAVVVVVKVEERDIIARHDETRKHEAKQAAPLTHCADFTDQIKASDLPSATALLFRPARPREKRVLDPDYQGSLGVVLIGRGYAAIRRANGISRDRAPATRVMRHDAGRSFLVCWIR